jgi:hypothetical protein
MQLLFNEPTSVVKGLKEKDDLFYTSRQIGSSWFDSALQMTAGSRQVGRPQ